MSSSAAATSTIDRPPLSLLGSEPWRAAREYLSLRLTQTRPDAVGDGHPVIIYPGLGTDGNAVAPLRRHCERLGYTALDWGMGFNTGPRGDLEEWTRELAEHTLHLLQPYRQRATLIGWSLGGLYARELAKLLKSRVRQVITIGTPFNTSADPTHVGWLFKFLSGNPPVLDETARARLRRPPPVPTTSIYSRSDGIVAWQACVHARRSPRVQDIEIDGSHIGMGWNPAVLAIVEDRLAQRPGKWRRYIDPLPDGADV